MRTRLHRSSRTGASRSLKSVMFLTCLSYAFLSLFVVACGGEDSGSSPGTAAGGEIMSTTAEATAMSPEELGDAIAATWSEAMQQLVALLDDQPKPATVKSQVQQLKDSYITEFVALGHMREALSDNDRAKVDSRALLAVQGTSEETWYVRYVEIYNAYPEDDLPFKNLLASFNVLSIQYANFDVLRQEIPEEAARLGIE